MTGDNRRRETNPLLTDNALDALFEAERSSAVLPDDALVSRILGDAAEVSAKSVAPVRHKGASGGFADMLRRWLAPVGGIPGLVTASVFAAVGLWAGTAGLEVIYDLPGMGEYVQAAIEGSAYDIEIDSYGVLGLIEDG